MIIQYLECRGRKTGIQKFGNKVAFWIGAFSAALAVYYSATALRLTCGFPCFWNYKNIKKKKGLLFQKIICEKVASTFQQMAGCLFIPHNIGVF